MIKRLAKFKVKELPYKTYITVLLKNEEKLDQADKLGIDGYSYITETPKMVMMFVEYTQGLPHKIDKEVWNLLQ